MQEILTRKQVELLRFRLRYYDKKTKEKLPLSKEVAPVSVTFYKLGNSLILDPTREESEACEVRVSYGISMWNKQYMINSCQKSGRTPFTQEELEQMMKILPKKYDEVSEKLKSFF